MVKIKGSWSYIDVYDGDRVVRIQGEMVVGGFVAYKDSMKNWLVPEDVPMSEEEKQDIIGKVIEKTKDSHMVISFE